MRKAAVPSVDVGGSVDQQTGLMWKKCAIEVSICTMLLHSGIETAKFCVWK